MNFEDLVKGAGEKGILRYGITDHIHTPFDYPDIEDSGKSYELHRKDDFFFGVEVSCVSQWELEIIEKGKFSGDITCGIKEGVGFSIGSDCHNRYYDLDLERCSDILENAGFGEADFLSPV